MTVDNQQRKKKVCFICQRYGLEVNGGAELLCREMAERMTDRYDVSVLTTKAISYQTWANEYTADEETINGVLVQRFPTVRERSANFNKIHTLLIRGLLPGFLQDKWFRDQGPVAPALLQAIRDGADTYDAFVFHTYLYYPTVFGLPLVAQKSVLVPDAHEEPPLHLRRVKTEFESAAALMYNTEEERELAERTFDVAGKPYRVGGAGVDVVEHPAPAIFREKYQIVGPYVVYVGRIDEAKGCREMFEWWERYKDLHPGDLTLVLMGKAAIPIPERSDIRALGFVPEEDKFSGIEGASFLWLPSRFESLSIVVLEALSLGVPVIVNGNCVVLQGHIGRSEAGLSYKTEEEFDRAADIILAGGPRVAAMRESGPRYVEQKYQWDIIIDKLSELVELVS